MGTYDGTLLSMRMEIKKEENSETLILVTLKKWNFSNPITSILTYDFYNIMHETTVHFNNTSTSSSSSKLLSNYKFGQSTQATTGLKSNKSLTNLAS